MLTEMAARVLIVDDVDELRLLFRLLLESDGRFEVVGEAANGREAIEEAARTKPDLVMIDLAMPEMDGLTAIPRLHRTVPGTRILVVSGFESEALIAKVLEACASEFIEKGQPSVRIAEAAHRVYLSPPKECSPAFA
jgi:DNA-binding NarL/FixJ family response regulator